MPSKRVHASAPISPAIKAPEPMPWDGTADRLAPLSLRAPASLSKKLDWIVEHSMGRNSKNSIAVKALEEYANRRIAEIQQWMRERAG